MSRLSESIIYRSVAVRAIEMALDGEAGDGYVCLVEGMCRFEQLSDEGEAWAADLAVQYRRALDDYALLYGVARE